MRDRERALELYSDVIATTLSLEELRNLEGVSQSYIRYHVQNVKSPYKSHTFLLMLALRIWWYIKTVSLCFNWLQTNAFYLSAPDLFLFTDDNPNYWINLLLCDGLASFHATETIDMLQADEPFWIRKSVCAFKTVVVNSRFIMVFVIFFLAVCFKGPLA